ncbi:hypothetical protein Tco_1355278 [Tanacetum coccineum]
MAWSGAWTLEDRPKNSCLSFTYVYFYPPKNISSPKDTKTPVESTTQVSLSSSMESSSPIRLTTSPPDYLFNESIFAELDNSLWIISRPLGSKPVPEEFNIHHWK